MQTADQPPSSNVNLALSLPLTEVEKMFANNIGCEVLVCGNLRGINLGLYFPEVWTKDGRIEANGVCVYFPVSGTKKNRVYVQNYNQVKLLDKKVIPSGIAILYGFSAWLTTREEPVTFSSKHEASIMGELLKTFCDYQGLEIGEVGINYEGIKPMQ